MKMNAIGYVVARILRMSGCSKIVGGDTPHGSQKAKTEWKSSEEIKLANKPPSTADEGEERCGKWGGTGRREDEQGTAFSAQRRLLF